LRLKDLEGLEQEECADRMQVSRPTFQRVLSSAREKVSRALVEGKAIRIEGGTYRLAAWRLRCGDCSYEFERPPQCITEEPGGLSQMRRTSRSAH